MRVKSQKLARSLQSNLTFRAFSPREAYREGSVKSAPHLRESRFLVAILTADDVEDLSRSFNGCLRGVSVITRELPATEVSGKAGQRQSYRGASSLSSMQCYSYGARWFFLGVL